MAISKLGQQVLGMSDKGSSDLAADMGQPSLPTSPLASNVIGANDQSAKMTGTPEQTANAIKSAFAAPQELKDIVRQDRVTSQKDDRDTSKGLQGIGALRNRVPELIMAKMKEQTIKDLVPPNISLDAAKTMTTDPKVATEIVIQATLVQNETDPVKKNAAYVALKKLVPDAANMAKLVGVDPETFAKSIAAQMPDSFKLSAFSPELLKDSGVTMEDLDNAAGLAPGEANKLTWGELKNKVQAEQTKRFADIPALEATAFDSTQPLQAQLEARKRLRELGVTSARTAEKQTSTLVDLIESDETILIGDKRYTIDNLLDDANIQTAITEALGDPESLKGTPYESLIPFVTAHKDEIASYVENQKTVGAAVEAGVATFNKAVTSSTGLPIPEGVLALIYTPQEIADAKSGIRPLDETKLAGTLWKIDLNYLASKIGTTTDQAKGRLSAAMDVLGKSYSNPDFGEMLKTFGVDKLAEYGFFTDPAAAISRMEATTKLIKQLEDGDPSNDVEAVSVLTGHNISSLELGTVDKLRVGLAGSTKEANLLDIKKVLSPALYNVHYTTVESQAGIDKIKAEEAVIKEAQMSPQAVAFRESVAQPVLNARANTIIPQKVFAPNSYVPNFGKDVALMFDNVGRNATKMEWSRFDATRAFSARDARINTEKAWARAQLANPAVIDSGPLLKYIDDLDEAARKNAWEKASYDKQLARVKVETAAKIAALTKLKLKGNDWNQAFIRFLKGLFIVT